jgi:hypothetical protein
VTDKSQPTQHGSLKPFRENDGYDGWRERIRNAGLPKPSLETLNKLHDMWLSTGGDAVGSFIQLSRTMWNK